LGAGHNLGKKLGISRDLTTEEIKQLLNKVLASMKQIDELVSKFNREHPIRTSEIFRECRVHILSCAFAALHQVTLIEENTPQNVHPKIKILKDLIDKLIKLIDKISTGFMSSPTDNIKQETNRLLSQVFKN